jgi:hypothetical protein
MHLTNLLKNLKFPHPSIEFTEILNIHMQLKKKLWNL